MAASMTTAEYSLADLLSGFAAVAPDLDCPVTGIALDSRQVQPGTLFLACSGGGLHGMDFLEQALENGACALAYEPDANWDEQRIKALPVTPPIPFIPVAQLRMHASEIAGRFYHHPSRHLSLTGITGTNGKTSSTMFLAQALGDQAKCGIVGTLGNGFPDALQPGTHTTPDPVGLQRILAELKEQGARSIAFPGISTGVYGYPKPKAARIALAAMLAAEGFERVIACCFSEPDAVMYRELLEDMQ